MKFILPTQMSSLPMVPLYKELRTRRLFNTPQSVYHICEICDMI